MNISELESFILSLRVPPLRLGGKYNGKWFARSGLKEGLGDTLEEAVKELMRKIDPKE